MGNVAQCAGSPDGPTPVGMTPELSNNPTEHGGTTVRDGLPPPAPGFENNPGAMDELHKRCKDVFPICFDGSKVMVQKGLSNHFQISHTLSLSQAMNGYRFGATYVGTKQLSPSEAYPVFLADTDASGNVTATVIHRFRQRIHCKFSSQVQQGKLAGAQLSGEYRGRVSTAGLTVANLDLVNDTGVLVGSYLRRLTPRIDLGAEMLYQYGKQVPGGQISVLSYGGRYTGDQFIASATASTASLNLSYYHRQQPNMQVGVEWETNWRMAESVASLAYQLDIPKANVTFRASADTNWTVGAVMEKKLMPLPFTLALSGMVNHTQQKSRFGIGLIVG